MTLSALVPTTFSEFEYHGWETLSSNYDDCWGHVTSSFIPTMLADFPALTGKRLLDLATGPGYGAGLAAEYGALATGVDFSAQMVAQAQESHPQANFMLGDAENLPFVDRQFDFAVSNFGFQHFSDPVQAMNEVARVLKPGGFLKFTLWAERNRNAASLILETALEQFATEQCRIPEGPNYNRLLEETELRTILDGANLCATSALVKLHVIPWELRDPDELYRAELSGSVRSGARLRQEPGPSLEKIRQAMSTDIEANYNENGNWVIPMAAYVISATKNEQ